VKRQAEKEADALRNTGLTGQADGIAAVKVGDQK
jgi:hypothetical protein